MKIMRKIILIILINNVYIINKTYKSLNLKKNNTNSQTLQRIFETTILKNRIVTKKH